MEDRERRNPASGEEPSEEGAPEDVELHRKKSAQNPMASDEAPAEGESDDDVELHRSRGVNPL